MMARTDHRGRRLCDGHRRSGHWRGYPCGAFATLRQRGRCYCRNHVDPTEQAVPLLDRERWPEEWV